MKREYSRLGGKMAEGFASKPEILKSEKHGTWKCGWREGEDRSACLIEYLSHFCSCDEGNSSCWEAVQIYTSPCMRSGGFVCSRTRTDCTSVQGGGVT